MSRLRRTAAAGLVVTLALGGCQRSRNDLTLQSYRDPYFPETYRLVLDACTFRTDASGDVHLAATAHFESAGAPGPIDQFLHIHLFWQPRPGRTPADTTNRDALIEYVIRSPAGVASYEGTGFIYPRKQTAERFIAQVEQARLQRTATSGDPPDVLGDVTLVGGLVATLDDARTVAIEREVAQLKHTDDARR